MLSDTGLTNPVVATNMAKFLDSMQTTATYIGIGAFVLFALRYRLRVHVWFQGECRDLVNEFAPWANDFITHRPVYEAIGCLISAEEGLTLVGHDLMSMNHWVVAIEVEKDKGPPIDETREYATDAETLFFTLYLSLKRLVLRTIADGDCGLDGMCLMFGMPRTIANRKNTVRV